MTHNFSRRLLNHALIRFWIVTAVVGVTLATSQLAGAELRYTAKVYDLDSNKDKVLYTYRSESVEKGDGLLVTNETKYPDGKLALHEEISFRKDESVSLIKVVQTQINAEGTIEIGDGKAKFTYTKDGKTKTETRDAGSDFIVGSQIPLIIAANWEKLMRGEKLKRRLAVVDRLDDFAFEYTKDREETFEGKKHVIIKMKPGSIFVSAIVSPLYFYMSADGKTLHEVRGRTTVKRDDGGKFKDLDAIIVYEKGPSISAASAAAGAPAAEAAAPGAKPEANQKPASGGNSK